ncbi:hypothetical protein AB0K48_42215 [Nonomuraea sp. NPDC055795]
MGVVSACGHRTLVRPLPAEDSMTRGSALPEDGAHSHVYGREFADGATFVHLAGAAAGDLDGPWEFWAGASASWPGPRWRWPG